MKMTNLLTSECKERKIFFYVIYQIFLQMLKEYLINIIMFFRTFLTLFTCAQELITFSFNLFLEKGSDQLFVYRGIDR